MRGGAVPLLGASLSLLFAPMVSVAERLHATFEPMVSSATRYIRNTVSTPEGAFGLLASASSALGTIVHAVSSGEDGSNVAFGFACTALACSAVSAGSSAYKNWTGEKRLTPGERVATYVGGPVSYAGIVPGLKEASQVATAAWAANTAGKFVAPGPGLHNAVGKLLNPSSD